MLVSVVQQYEPVISIHIPPPSWACLTSPPSHPSVLLTVTLDLLLDFSLLEGPHLSPLFQHNIRSWYFSSASRLTCPPGSSVNKHRDSTKWCKFGWKAIGHWLSSSLSSKTHPPSHLFNFKLPWLPTPSNSLCPLHLGPMTNVHPPQMDLRPHSAKQMCSPSAQNCIPSPLVSPKGSQLCLILGAVSCLFFITSQ